MKAPSRPAAVLWDFSGVITSGAPEALQAYERACGLPRDFLRTISRSGPGRAAWTEFEHGQVGVSDFADRFEEIARSAGGDIDARQLLSRLSGDPRPAMVEAVRRCQQHLKTGLLTNNFLIGQSTVDYGPVLSYFDAIVESARVGCRKPDPRFYLIGCELLGIDPSDAIFLDDTATNLVPAEEMGMRTILVDDPAEALASLESAVGFPLA